MVLTADGVRGEKTQFVLWVARVAEWTAKPRLSFSDHAAARCWHAASGVARVVCGEHALVPAVQCSAVAVRWVRREERESVCRRRAKQKGCRSVPGPGWSWLEFVSSWAVADDACARLAERDPLPSGEQCVPESEQRAEMTEMMAPAPTQPAYSHLSRARKGRFALIVYCNYCRYFVSLIKLRCQPAGRRNAAPQASKAAARREKGSAEFAPGPANDETPACVRRR